MSGHIGLLDLDSNKMMTGYVYLFYFCFNSCSVFSMFRPCAADFLLRYDCFVLFFVFNLTLLKIASRKETKNSRDKKIRSIGESELKIVNVTKHPNHH